MRFKIKMLFFAFICVMSVACNSKKEQKTTKQITVTSAPALIIEKNISNEFSFISKPFRTSELSFRIGGPVNAFDAYSGNFYYKGQVIAAIDSRDFIIRNERAEAIYKQAKAEYDRIKILFDKNNVSASVYENARSNYASAKSALDATANELIDTKLIAPFNGYIGDVFIEKYQDIKPAQAVLTFVDLNQLKIEAYVNQEIALKSAGIKNLKLVFDAIPNTEYTAQVIEISKSTTRNNLSYLLTATLKTPEGKLPAGMSGKINLNINNSTTTCIAVPQTAIFHNNDDGDFVWIINPSTLKVSKRIIEMGTILPSGNVEIKSGITDGEIVATSQLRFLSNGVTVSINN